VRYYVLSDERYPCVLQYPGVPSMVRSLLAMGQHHGKTRLDCYVCLKYSLIISHTTCLLACMRTVFLVWYFVQKHLLSILFTEFSFPSKHKALHCIHTYWRYLKTQLLI
jgi:hypothetical protein